MLIRLSVCALLVGIGVCSFSQFESKRHSEVLKVERRTKRSAKAIGATAAKKMLNGAKFVYTNGLDNVYVKPGTFRQACDDFDSVSPQKVEQFITKGVMKTTGYVGNRHLTLQKNSYTGATVIQIRKLVPNHSNAKMKTTGYVGNRHLTLQKNSYTGATVIQIRKLVPTHSNAKAFAQVDDLIIYE